MTSPLMGAAATVGTIAGLTDDEKAQLNELWRCWTQKMRRNLLRSQYYDQRNTLKDLGIAIPPHLTDLEMVLGWPAKAVDVLARRCKFESFTFPSEDSDPLGLREMWDDNDMLVELPQTFTSAFAQACAFLMVTKGMAGEPDVLITSQSALYGSGVWDYRLRRLKSAFSVLDTDSYGRVVEFVLFVPGVTIRARWDRSWQIERYPHSLDRIPVEVLPFQPRLDRPFGCSRISRAVMGLSDAALRTVVRSEVHAEFFSAPQRYAMGADESMFQDPDGKTITQWEAVMGRVWAAPSDEDGNVPQMGQFPQSSPQPHVEQLRMLASAFCGETDLPLSALGIVHDNPSSAEAIEAAERELIAIARATMECSFGPRLARLARTAVEIRDGSVPDNIRDLAVRWSPPENLPISAVTDAVVKQVSAIPWLAETPIPFEDMDWPQEKVERAMQLKRKASAAQVMSALATQQANDGNPGGTQVPAGSGEQPGPAAAR